MTASAAAERTEDERAAPTRTLAIACGALARELLALARGPLASLDVACLPAALHNRPDRIPDAIRGKISGEPRAL